MVPNRSPVAVRVIDDATVAVGDSVNFNLAAYFDDPDGDALSYSVSSSDVAVASLSVLGTVLQVRGVAKGMTTVMVVATDPEGLVARQSFAVEVPNSSP